MVPSRRLVAPDFYPIIILIYYYHRYSLLSPNMNDGPLNIPLPSSCLGA